MILMVLTDQHLAGTDLERTDGGSAEYEEQLIRPYNEPDDWSTSTWRRSIHDS